MVQVFYIDLNNVKTKDELQDVISKELPVPDYYGRNLDALYDVLTESDESRILVIYNCSTFEEQQPKYMESLKRMLKDAEEECPELRVKIFP